MRELFLLVFKGAWRWVEKHAIHDCGSLEIFGVWPLWNDSFFFHFLYLNCWLRKKEEQFANYEGFFSCLKKSLLSSQCQLSTQRIKSLHVWDKSTICWFTWRFWTPTENFGKGPHATNCRINIFSPMCSRLIWTVLKFWGERTVVDYLQCVRHFVFVFA